MEKCQMCGQKVKEKTPTKNFLRAKKEKKRNLADAGGEK